MEKGRVIMATHPLEERGDRWSASPNCTVDIHSLCAARVRKSENECIGEPRLRSRRRHYEVGLSASGRCTFVYRHVPPSTNAIIHFG